ncbi:tRNA (uracil-5-)-methyltransferase homolog A isoform X1 [Nilaparvata lugens]|uniref:tRNA (uracil-5-)-methyltransferase homolog A isoform X1 n=1 Tax=Nilaparvata lugens TaxID=108931 RepID=UPI00193E3E75|nr:tRNA (uracil-5-)-methyltransferase homolog A isoform X1 [Nilaparvata lugens]XP_039291991.1 tRNA (uracil-5-)-methyltransferase homolog A isoform X1 [Nilaparvata lugens]
MESTQIADNLETKTEADVIPENDAKTGDEEKKTEIVDPYAYLKRQDFTSEKFKIEIRGLPKFYGIGELKKLLNVKLKLGSNKIKPPKRGSHWVYVCFRSEEDREEALKAIDGFTWKNKTLSAENANAAPDPLVKRRIANNQQDDNTAKRCKLEDVRTQEEIIKSNATPLCDVPYEEQLKMKQQKARKLLERFGNELATANRSLKPWLDSQKAKFDGLPCQLLDIVSVKDHCDGYRNKCEFTIGINQETKEKAIGFRLGSYVLGNTGVGPIQNLKNIPPRMKEAVSAFEKFVRSSELDVFDPETQSGHWKQLTARYGFVTDQLMLIVGVNPQIGSPQQLTEQQLEDVKQKLRDFFTDGEGKCIKVTSLYFQIIRKKQAGEILPSPEHILGEKYIVEVLSGLKFKISPESFFQINTKTAELLYDNVGNLADLNGETTLLDICCGTGTIGLSLASKCGQVLGLELIEEAVKYAKENAEENKITNCEFFCGKAEEIITSVACKAVHKKVVAVVDPPRAGLHQKAVILLRRLQNIEKMVFLACDAKAALKNFVDLGRPASKTLTGDPYVPIAAVAVDLFPHTNHCELVLCFQRMDPGQLSSNDNK